MNPQTRIIGIDLGTTNSGVARLEGTSVRVFRNKDGDEYTPSAVTFGKNGRKVVGREAYQNYETDPKNVAVEFKRNMGSPTPFTFEKSGLAMRPEQLSAEVLQCLRADVERATQEAITHAIITVPAYFSQPACQATTRAATLAGLTSVETLIEPVAAAMAYGLDKAEKDEYWMVYDFGGGTFDVAIIQLKHGALTVVQDGGNNQLGGKNIDWAIVDKYLIPQVESQPGFAGIRRGEDEWLHATGALKYAAEKAKKSLSAEEEAFILAENLLSTDGTHKFDLECTLFRCELEAVARPIIEQTMVICRDVLQKSGIPAGHIKKLILVGGPTMMPLLRNMLSDSATGLGIPLDVSQDPLTVVAKGAAIFGATKAIARAEDGQRPVEAGKLDALISFPAMSPDEEVMGTIAIRSAQADADFSGWHLEITNSTPGELPWRGGKTPLTQEGKAILTCVGYRGSENKFQIELTDPQGRAQEVHPNHFGVSFIGVLPPAAKVIRSLGIALADKSVLTFFPKGEALPARRTFDLYTTRALQAGEKGDLLKVPIVEGEERRSDRNFHVGTLEIPADQIDRDIPFHSKIEVTIEYDASRCVTASASLPVLGDEAEPFKKVIQSEWNALLSEELEARLAELRSRMEEIEKETVNIEAFEAAAALKCIKEGDAYNKLSSLIQTAKTDRGESVIAESSINAVHVQLDQIEESLTWHRLVFRINDTIADIKKDTDDAEKSTAEQRQKYSELAAQARKAIDDKDPYLLEHLQTQLHSLRAEMWKKDTGRVGNLFFFLKEGNLHYSDRAQADRLLARGNACIEMLSDTRFKVKDIDELNRIISQLVDLLPNGEKPGDSDVREQ